MALFLLIVFSMLLVIAPVMALRPSPRERRLARLREVARQHRVKVRPILLRQHPQFSVTLERNPHLANSNWSSYELVADEEQRGPSISGQWIQRKTPEGRYVWESVDVRQKTTPVVEAVLAQWEQRQQPDFLSLTLGPRSVALVWNENGDTAEAEAVCRLLNELMQA